MTSEVIARVEEPTARRVVIVSRVRMSPAARLGCALGWIAVAPAACCASAAAVAGLRWVNSGLERIQPIVVSAFDQELLRVDLLERLGLAAAAESIGTASELGIVLFAVLFWVFLLAGAVMGALVVVFVAAGYNFLAAAGLALQLETEEGAQSAPPPSVSEMWRRLRQRSAESDPSSPPSLPG
jgi:hypothetical protein